MVAMFAVGCANSTDPIPEDYDSYDAQFDNNVDFSLYQTFGFVDFPEDQLEDAPEYIVNNNNRIQNAVTDELIELGLTEAEDPDLLVTSLAYTEQDSAYVYDCTSAVYWWGDTLGYSNCAWVDVDYVEYDVGTILILGGDPSEEIIVFTGVMQGIVDSSSDSQARIDEGLDYIFGQWPG